MFGMRSGPANQPTSNVIASGLIIFVGLSTSLRLGLHQLGVLGAPWEPFFGAGTERVLHSAFSRALPVPDALLGAFAYAVEGVLLLICSRSRSRGWQLAYGTSAIGMALVGGALVAMQAAVVHAWCTLCLASAALSFGVFVLALPKMSLAVRSLFDGHRSHASSGAFSRP
jgi:uncharacterized membrane protein